MARRDEQEENEEQEKAVACGHITRFPRRQDVMIRWRGIAAGCHICPACHNCSRKEFRNAGSLAELYDAPAHTLRTARSGPCVFGHAASGQGGRADGPGPPPLRHEGQANQRVFNEAAATDEVHSG